MPEKKTERVVPLSARNLRWGIIAFVGAYQVVLMWVWTAFPAVDWFLLRISLSFADALAVAAVVLAVWTYGEYEKTAYSKDYAYLQDTIFHLRRHGVDPEKSAVFMARMMGWGQKHADRIETVLEMPDDEFSALLNARKRRPLPKDPEEK